MSFLGKARLIEFLTASPVIDNYDVKLVEGASYPLSLADEHYITSYNSDGHSKRSLDEANKQLVIPPGQVALLMTHERIELPTDKVAFITVKAKIKLSGLVNISGFHVDPGFKGRLKYTVFNAGASNVVLDRRQKCFSIMFSDLSEKTAGENQYTGNHQDQSSVTADDVGRLSGMYVSPHALLEDFNEVKRKLDRVEKLKTDNGFRLTLLVTALVAIFVAVGKIALDGSKNEKAEQALFDRTVNDEVRRAIAAYPLDSLVSLKLKSAKVKIEDSIATRPAGEEASKNHK